MPSPKVMGSNLYSLIVSRWRKTPASSWLQDLTWAGSQPICASWQANSSQRHRRDLAFRQKCPLRQSLMQFYPYRCSGLGFRPVYLMVEMMEANNAISHAWQRIYWFSWWAWSWNRQLMTGMALPVYYRVYPWEHWSQDSLCDPLPWIN